MEFLRKLFYYLVITLLLCCSTTDESEGANSNDSMYFPTTTEWITISPEALGWDTSQLQPLYDYLSANHTRAFIILRNGKIVIEKYWGNNFINQPFTQSSQWYWASAGKSLTAFLVGIAQEENLLNINQKTSQHIGEGWSSLSTTKENLITLKHQLTMTTGLEYNVTDLDCTLPTCLTYKADAGVQWYYHNAPYTLLEKVVANASGMTYNEFTDSQLESKIGMSGTWIPSGYNNVYWSTARDMARFGLLIQNKGKWNTTTVLGDINYLNSMLNTSQNLNLSYGYLWWLNGKNSAIFPGNATVFPTSVTPNAPTDMVSALGKNGQFLDIVPSKGLVIVRMGEEPSDSLVPVTMHNEMWQKISLIIN